MRYLSTPFFILPILLLAVRTPHAEESSLPVRLFRNLCFEANRIEGEALRPSEAMGWTAADKRLRAVLGVTHDPRVELYVREPGEDGALIALKIVEAIAQHGIFSKGEMQHTCEIVYSGPITAERIRDDLEDFYGARGKSLGMSTSPWAKGVPDGWRYWCWAHNPDRGSKRWRSDQKGCMVVAADWFYRSRELIQIFLKEKMEADPPFLTISFTWTYRPSRDSPKPKPVVGVTPLGSAEEREKQEEKE